MNMNELKQRNIDQDQKGQKDSLCSTQAGSQLNYSINDSCSDLQKIGNLDMQNEEFEKLFQIPNNESITSNVMRKLVIACIIGFIFFCMELVGGILSQSLAIISDAAHMFSDISGFFVSIIAVWYGQKPSNKQFGYGYQRAEVIGALGSIMMIWGLTVYLLFEATIRIICKTPVQDPFIMLITAAFGLLCNLLLAKVLHSRPTITHQCSHDHDHNHDHHHHHSHDHDHDHDHHKHSHSSCSSHKYNKNQSYDQQLDEDEENQCKNQKTQQTHSHHNHNHTHDHELQHKNLSKISESDNYNLRAAMIHVIGDIIQSAGVLLSAILIYIFGVEQDEFGHSIWNPWHLFDPICTYLFSIIVLLTTVKIAKDCFIVLMEGLPKDLDIENFKRQLTSIENVKQLHDIHVWSISIGKPSFSAHLEIENPEINQKQVLIQATKIARQFGIYHSTIQLEDNSLQNQNGYIKCHQNIHN